MLERRRLPAVANRGRSTRGSTPGSYVSATCARLVRAAARTSRQRPPTSASASLAIAKHVANFYRTSGSALPSTNVAYQVAGVSCAMVKATSIVSFMCLLCASARWP